MRTGRRVKNRISDDRGISLVELIVVISIMAVMTGVVSLSVSMMFSRDASYVAVRLDDALTEARTLSMSRDGQFTFTLHTDGLDPTGSYVQIMRSVGGAAPSEYKKILLDKSVTIAVAGDSTPVSGDISIEFDKSKGCIKKINSSESDIKGVYTFTVTSTRGSSKTKVVNLISTTGRHYISQ